MNFELLHGFGSGSATSLIKLYTGLNPPDSPKEYSIWVKADIPVPKMIFDKDFSLSKAYDDKSLVFYTTSNPNDQGYKILTQLFPGSKKIDLKVPLYLAAYRNNGTWEYPIVQVFIGGQWKYLSGSEVDNTVRIITAILYTTNVSIQVNDYYTDGTAININKIVNIAVPGPLKAITTLPIDGRIYLIATQSNSASGPLTLFVFDKNYNLITTKAITFANDNTGSQVQMLADEQYVYVCQVVLGGYILYLSKIDITTNTVIKTISINMSESQYKTAQNSFWQDANYLYINKSKINKADLTIAANIAALDVQSPKMIDRSGRLIRLKYTANAASLDLELYILPAVTLLKTINIIMPYTMAGGSLYNAILDKDDNIIMTGVGSGGPTNAPANSTFITKLTRDNVNDTWVVLTTVVGYSGANGYYTVPKLDTDVFGNIYGNFTDGNGRDITKLNPNLQKIWTKMFSDAWFPHTIEPCTIHTDYRRNYYK